MESQADVEGGGSPGAKPTAADGGLREIDHEEFDPVGTLALAGLYLGLLLVLWFFMYFVEFLENGPTVVG
ncbi:MAG: hypothetical protein ACOCT0_05330 [Halobacteriota archaeon]